MLIISKYLILLKSSLNLAHLISLSPWVGGAPRVRESPHVPRCPRLLGKVLDGLKVHDLWDAVCSDLNIDLTH